MFGLNPLWGQQQPVDVGGSGALPALAPQAMPQMPQLPQQGGGMFGSGKFGVGQAIVAALNGYLASTRGPSQEVGAQNLQMMAAMRQRQMEHQQSLDDYNRKRTDDNADYVTHLQQKALYDPPQPDEMTQHMIAAGIDPHSPEGKALYSASLDPIVNTLQYGPITRSQALKMGAGGNGPKVGDIVDDPRIHGGPAPQAPGTFPY